MTVSDDLRAAKALIDTPEKWGRHLFQDAFGRMCIRGACGAAAGGIFGGKGALSVETALLMALPAGVRQIAGPLSRLSVFNDDPSTTHADIMALFDRAIAAQEKTDD